jgi:hypothetical protein
VYLFTFSLQLFDDFGPANLILPLNASVSNAECFRYKIGASHISSFDDGEHENISRDAGQLMISSGTFISMGVGEDGAR